MPTPQQYKKLRDALISAFPLKSSLEQLLFFELGKNLNQITQDSNLQTVVFQLIQTAESQGWLIELVSAACKENPGNSNLAAIAIELLPTETSSNLEETKDNFLTKEVELSEISNSYSSTNVAFYISLESANSIRTKLQINGQEVASGLMPYEHIELIIIIDEYPKLAYRYQIQENEDEFWLKNDIDNGIRLYSLTIAQPIRRILDRLESSVIQLIIADKLQYIPWELMHDGNTFLSLKHDISRCINSEISFKEQEELVSVSGNGFKRQSKKSFFIKEKKILIFSHGQSEFSNSEVNKICEVLKNEHYLTVLHNPRRREVLDALYSGQDVVHFIGHSDTDRLALIDGFLDVDMLKDAMLQNSTSLVILATCSGGLLGYQLALNGQNVLCSLTWLSTDVNLIILPNFYENILLGKSFGESLRLAKKKAYPYRGWWIYILYCNPYSALQSVIS